VSDALVWHRVEGGYDSNGPYTIRRREGCSRTTGFELRYEGGVPLCPIHRTLTAAQHCADALNEKRLNR